MTETVGRAEGEPVGRELGVVVGVAVVGVIVALDGL